MAPQVLLWGRGWLRRAPPSPLPLPYPKVSAALGSGAERPRPSLPYLCSRLGPRIFFSLTDIHRIPFK